MERKTIKLILIGLIVAVIVFNVLYLFNFRLRFFFEEEMLIYLDPNDISLDTYHSNPFKLNFSVEIDNFAFCSAICTYELKDVSQGKILYSGLFENKTFSFSKDLEIDGVGRGQKLYSFNVDCKNQKTTFCHTSSKNYTKSALVDVNYDFSTEELDYIDYFLNNSDLAFKTLENNLEKLKIINKTLNHYDFNDLFNFFKKDYNELYNEFFLFESKAKNLYYDYMNKSIFNEKFNQFNYSYNSFFNDVMIYNESIEALYGNFTKDIFLIGVFFNDFNNLISKFNETLEKSLFITNVNDSAIEFLAKDSRSKISDFKKDYDEYYSVDVLLKEFLALENSVDLYFNEFDREFSNFENNVSMILEFSSRIKDITDFDDLYMNDLESDNLQDMCHFVSNVTEKINLFNSKTEDFIDTNYPFLREIDEFSNVTEQFKDYRNEFITNTTLVNLSDYLKDFKLNESFENVSLSKNISFNNTSLDYFNFSWIKNKELNNMTSLDSNFFSDFNKKYCPKVFDNESIPYLNFSYMNYEIQFLNESVSLSFPTNFPRYTADCCYNGECETCCDNKDCSDIYPVIFVHGHAFNEKTSPENSLNAFSNMQKELEKYGFVNAGALSSTSYVFNVDKNNWGRNPHPFSVRVSYYYYAIDNDQKIDFVSRKNDGIENYAIRLKDFIDLILYRTGKEKVNIVSHSMGGLVSRSYIDLFGSSKVNKLIMIGTPNHGISGRIDKYCGVYGNPKECEDMSSGSLFLSNLNEDPKVKNSFYTIRSNACEMDVCNGDGVVCEDSVFLKGANNYLINGSCNDFLGTNLHSDLIDPEKYPKVTELVKRILKT